MSILTNPFVTSGYVSAEYFCDRKLESERLIREIKDGNNLALISTRRMGKTGLIQHCFNDKKIQKNYYTFFVDIYATKSLREFVFSLSKVILEGLKPFGRRALESFWNSVKTLQAGISFDVAGNPSFNVGLGDILSEEVTLNEIFKYLSSADKPCIVAIDEFQQIASYAEKNLEAQLRTYVQHCNNARFIFAGSQRHTMGNMFLSAARPFYQSVSMMHLGCISLPKYIEFATHHFKTGSKTITSDTINAIYDQFDGVTWYLQKMLNVLYSYTPQNGVCSQQMIAIAIDTIIDSYRYTYSDILFRMPEKQKELLIAITKEGKAKGLTSGDFVRKYKLVSSSSVQSALRGLLEKDFITHEMGEYRIYDKFLGIWLQRNY
ncbi:MAG: ATPase [Rikenellaceae bacterium]